ncbi:hypothetical protein CEXT_341571 [Caerostris extrusa]|uniref:Uncharacterized protein n=1 Tax=Caerostris extrusa TaxID=172846 RepID=A0AAV4SNV6_CAEEX|nr:hypothetical protein CEXT_341571 [Caerostris extrusa]
MQIRKRHAFNSGKATQTHLKFDKSAIPSGINVSKEKNKKIPKQQHGIRQNEHLFQRNLFNWLEWFWSSSAIAHRAFKRKKSSSFTSRKRLLESRNPKRQEVTVHRLAYVGSSLGNITPKIMNHSKKLIY